MNRFDADIIHFLNQFAQRSWVADHLISLITDNELLTGGFIMNLFWWAWFRNDDFEGKDRRLILSTIFLSTAALFLARMLALLLPFRERPLQNPILHFRLPLGEDSGTLLGWTHSLVTMQSCFSRCLLLFSCFHAGWALWPFVTLFS